MIAEVESAPARRSVATQIWAAAVAGWAVVAGAAPHVLHHVGPLAGAAFLAGAGGTAIFFVAGLVVSVPMLRRLYLRFGTMLAPFFAVVAFAALFSVSSLFIAPRLTGTEKPSAPGIEQPVVPPGHARHHGGRSR